MKHIKAPGLYDSKEKLIFLAGSIEMGTAENWQEKVVGLLSDTDWTVLNPRRDKWESSWEQDIKNEKFLEQVTWELQAQEDATAILMYFDPNTKSPITLLELGLFAKSGKLSVVCPDGYWRKGNVEVVCVRYGVDIYRTIEEMIGSRLLNAEDSI